MRDEYLPRMRGGSELHVGAGYPARGEIDLDDFSVVVHERSAVGIDEGSDEYVSAREGEPVRRYGVCMENIVGHDWALVDGGGNGMPQGKVMTRHLDDVHSRRNRNTCYHSNDDENQSYQ